MAMGPRLDLRQSQSLVMTPQLRQAIKLLQFSNVEVAAFVEEELERNPLLERDELAESLPSNARRWTRRPRRHRRRTGRRVRGGARLKAFPPRARRRWMPNTPKPTTPAARRTACACPTVPAVAGFRPTIAASRISRNPPPPCANICSEQLRLSFPDAADRLIGAYLIALLEPSGRLTVGSDGAGPGHGHGCRKGGGGAPAHDALRADRHVRPRPARMPRGATGREQPARSGHADPARQSRSAGPPRHAAS